MNKHEFSQKFEQIAALVKAKLETAPGCHDFEHTLRVLRNAEYIAEQEPEADITLVKLAAILHDLARPEELAQKGRICHAEQGAIQAEEILLEYDFSADLTQKICNCIRSHRYRGNGPAPISIEEKIIYDADKLDSIGAIGIARAFHFAGRENARVHNHSTEALSGKEYSREDSAYREYLVKLRHIKSKMTTQTGRKLAEKRTTFMENFFSELNFEVFGNEN